MTVKVTSKNEKTIHAYAVKGYRPEKCTDNELLKALAAQCYANYSMRYMTPLYENSKHFYILCQAGTKDLYDALIAELEKRGYKMCIDCSPNGTTIDYTKIA